MWFMLGFHKILCFSINVEMCTCAAVISQDLQCQLGKITQVFLNLNVFLCFRRIQAEFQDCNTKYNISTHWSRGDFRPL